MSKSIPPKFLGKTGFPQTIAIIGLFLLLTGYYFDNALVISSGWISLIAGAGWLLILFRIRIYRLP